MDVCCSFKSTVGGNCGFDKRSRKQETVIIPLLACSKRIDSHLTSFGFSGPKDEVDLILSRAAIFSPPVNIHSMTICPAHRAYLGLGWTSGSSTKCRVPSEISNHGKSHRTWPKGDRGIGKRDSQIILMKTGVLLQVGSGKLTLCTLFNSSRLKFIFVFSKLHVSSWFFLFRYLRNMSKNPKGPVYWQERGCHCNSTICRHETRQCCWRDGKPYSGRL